MCFTRAKYGDERGVRHRASPLQALRCRLAQEADADLPSLDLVAVHVMRHGIPRIAQNAMRGAPGSNVIPCGRPLLRMPSGGSGELAGEGVAGVGHQSVDLVAAF